MADDESRIIIDEDWKSQVQREKEEAKKSSDEKPAEDGDSDQEEASAFTMLVTTLGAQALMALGLFLLNVWMILRWYFTQHPRRGGRKLDTRQFQLSRFAKFIVRALERHYGYVRSITAVAVPLP